MVVVHIYACFIAYSIQASAYEECATIAEQSSLEAILAGLEAMNIWRGDKGLDEIEIKTLIIWGDRDRTYPWSQTEHLWRRIATSSLAVIPDCAHAVHLEKPDLFNSILRDFVVA